MKDSHLTLEQKVGQLFIVGFQGYAPDTDLDNVRNRVVGILFGLIVTGLAFKYIWPERAPALATATTQ